MCPCNLYCDVSLWGHKVLRYNARVEVWPVERSFSVMSSVRDPGFVDNLVLRCGNSIMRRLLMHYRDEHNRWMYMRKPLSSALAVDIDGEGMKTYIEKFSLAWLGS